MTENEHKERSCIFDPLVEFMAHYADAKSTKKEATAYEGLSLEDKLKRRIIDGDKIGLDTDLAEALKSYPALDIINNILLDGMKTVGELFGSGEMQLPFVLQSAETMKSAVRYLEPYMEKTEGSMSKGKMVLATVKGDVHDIGKNLVDIILTNNGYSVYNLGIKVGLEQMLEEFKRQNADALGMSGLLVKSTAIMKENLEVMQERGLQVPVILGGAALTRKFVEKDLREIYSGTLSYAQDAFDGLHFMEKLKAAAGGTPRVETEARKLTLAEMLTEMESSRQELLQTIASVPESDYHLPETFNKWSLRDVLVHMIGWEQLASKRISIIKNGKLPEPIADHAADEWNAQFISRSTLRSSAEILAALSSTRNELTMMLKQVNDEEFLRSAEIPPMQVWLPEFSYVHERHHLEKIKSWLADREHELDNATGEESKMAMARRELPWLGGKSSTPNVQKKSEERLTRSLNVPTPPFWGVEVREQFILDKVWEYLNEVALFRGQWQLKRGKLSPQEHAKIIDQVAKPKLNELKLLCKQQRILKPQAVYGYFPCWSEGDDVVVLKPQQYSDTALFNKWDSVDLTTTNLTEYKRFTFPRQPSGRKLGIADFFLTKEEAQAAGRTDVVTFTAVTVGRQASQYTAELFKTNQYADYLYLHGLSVETAEALAEYLHKIIRAELGIDQHDADTIQRLFSQGYQGSRYSFGYPACPELADQVKLFELLRPERIDITLTEEYHLEPEQSTTAIICHHPEARYFGIK